MTSLGYRVGGEAIPTLRRPKPMVSNVDALPAPSLMSRMAFPTKMPTGIVFTLLYSAYAALLPLLYYYVEYDFTSDSVRAGSIVAASMLAIFTILANDCCTWYNMVLFFHTALEIKLLNTALRFATDTSTDNMSMVWTWIGSVVIIVHLVPFFLIDKARLLTLLALAGVPVNAAVALYMMTAHEGGSGDAGSGDAGMPLDISFAFLVTLSAQVLLLMTLLVANVQGQKPSLLTKFTLALS